MQWTGSLPAQPALGEQYDRWQQLYQALYACKGWRQAQPPNRFAIDIEEDDVTHISEAEFQTLGEAIKQGLNRWLSSEEFMPIERQLRTRLDPAREIRVTVTSENRRLLKLPWHQWHFFDDYPKADLALSLPAYTRSVKAPAPSPPGTVKILAILGNSFQINVARDRQLLEQLPDTELRFLVEPDMAAIHQQLWESAWDVLFFAGHSSSQNQGYIQINQTDCLTLEELRYGLKQAIARGLKLAIFNSCDGLELAWKLADLHIPHVIVMREPVPDKVAQEFLKSFLIAFAGGKPLYLAVREARERLQVLESEFPGATWLPVLCQNPAELPQTWQEWRDGHPIESKPPQSPPRTHPSPHLPAHPSPRTLLLSSLLISLLILGVRSLGFLQPLELWAFDRLLQLRPAEPPDSRFLIVTIDEADIQAQNPHQRRGSLSDPALSQLLQILNQHQAALIGLDIYRDFAVEPAYPALAAQLRTLPNLIAICKSSDRNYDPTGKPPPPEVTKDRIGFSDFLEDRDGVLRRHLLFMTPDPICPCAAPYAFSTQLALYYLESLGIAPEFTDEKNLQLQDTVFPRLMNRSGGYQRIDAQGSQILLNYRAVPSLGAIAPQVALQDVLAGRINPAAIQGRIVLIGVTAPSGGDYWLTPYGVGPTQRVPGVIVQAHMTSQILSAVLDGRPLLTVWVGWGEGLWILGWALVGGIVGGLGRSPLQWNIAGAVSLGILTGASLILFTQGQWVPLVPAALAWVTTGSIINYVNRKV
ncbi:MAG: CHASE2 domain-containing protein [Synechococcales bacterium]|nr:CHASE2 domain-containing protein [Synechococcales bacterium]